MIGAESLAAGVAVGIAAEQSNKFIEQLKEDLSTDDFWGLFKEQRDLLRIIAERLSPILTPNLGMPIKLEPYPKVWIVPEYIRAHLCLFIASGTNDTAAPYTAALGNIDLYIEIPGAGRHIRTVTPGWTQVDFPEGTQISTADNASYAAYFSFRDDPINDNNGATNIAQIGGIDVQMATADDVAGSKLLEIAAGLFDGTAFDRWRSDATGIGKVSLYVKTTTAGDTVLTNGQALMAGSLPVTIASDQTPLNTGTATRSNVNAAASDTALLASNSGRRGATFFNDSVAILYLAFGAAAASITSYTVQIAGGGYYEMPRDPIYTGAIRGIWSSATGAVRITELT